MNEDLIIIYGGFSYVLITGILLFWIKNDVINKLKLYFLAPKGAKLFSLYRKDGTREEFVECARTGGVVEREGDKYAILRSTAFTDRNKNAPQISLVEGNLNSIDPFDMVDQRVDTKQLRALYFAEREKAKSDLNPDVKLLKMLVIIAICCCGLAVIIGFLNWQQIGEFITAATPAVAPVSDVVMHL